MTSLGDLFLPSSPAHFPPHLPCFSELLESRSLSALTFVHSVPPPGKLLTFSLQLILLLNPLNFGATISSSETSSLISLVGSNFHILGSQESCNYIFICDTGQCRPVGCTSSELGQVTGHGEGWPDSFCSLFLLPGRSALERIC